jgi:hypothetical protein
MGNNEKEPTSFIKKHKRTIVLAGVTALTVTVSALFIYNRAFWKGAEAGFHGGINWFDKTFPGLTLRKLYTEWAMANPTKIIYP